MRYVPDDEPFWRHIHAVERAYVEDDDARQFRLRLFRSAFSDDQIKDRKKRLDQERKARGLAPGA